MQEIKNGIDRTHRNKYETERLDEREPDEAACRRAQNASGGCEGVVWPILGTTPTGCVGAPTGENTALLRVTEHLRRFGPKG